MTISQGRQDRMKQGRLAHWNDKNENGKDIRSIQGITMGADKDIYNDS